MTDGYDFDLAYESTTPEGRTRFEVEVVEDVEPPEIARLQFSLTNESDRELRPAMTSGVPPPFGILKLYGPAGAFLLWSDSYRSHDGVHTEGVRVTGRVKPTCMTHLEPHERVTETYSVRSDEYGLRSRGGLRPGEYEILGAGGRPITIDGQERPVDVVVTER
ncbi:hypothetical protein BRD13_02850 [Halobacteriales archaeon SW_5_70_135]|nr:MAG: hypothetical protein BRD13_02850 [Halobacteriales archaeon SW_5_70_135]